MSRGAGWRFRLSVKEGLATAWNKRRVGIPLAGTRDDYVSRAVALADDPQHLLTLRAELRGRMAGSPLCDAAAFARGVEAAYRDMWRRWCAGSEGS